MSIEPNAPETKKSQVAEQIDSINHALGTLGDSLGTLCTRTAPILKISEPSKEDEQKCIDGLVPLAKQLYDIKIKIAAVSDNILDLIRRIEL